MKPTGWRKPTPGLGVAEQHAQAGEQANISKTRAFVAVKRVGAHLGLKAGDMLLLDLLGAFTQTQDWETGQRPIVWASNAYLMTQTGFSLSTLKRHARRLVEAGVIAHRDSPNGKRWGRRDGQGRIVEAYGFDLSPLAARAEEFEALQAELAAERAQCQALKRQITITRRRIRARLEAECHDGLWARFEALLARLPRKVVAASVLEALLQSFKRLEARIEAAVATENMAPKEAETDPHIRITNQPKSSSSNGLENSPGEVVAPKTKLDLATLMQACPEFSTWAKDIGGYLRNWSELARVAGQLRPMIGIPERTWLDAQHRLGTEAAGVAMALVFEKHATGEVAAPGGYLRGMVDKAGAGALHLERSIYGRLKQQQL